MELTFDASFFQHLASSSLDEPLSRLNMASRETPEASEGRRTPANKKETIFVKK